MSKTNNTSKAVHASTDNSDLCGKTFVPELWKTEFDKRVVAFSKVSGLDEEQVREVLAQLGATGKNEHSLKLLDSDEFLPMGDLFEKFCDSGIIPKGILRMSVAELRGRRAGDTCECVTEKSFIAQPDIADAIRAAVASNRPKTDWSDKELLDHYDRDETEIAKILHTRTRGRPCVVFNEDGSVNIEVSTKLVKIARRQPTANTHMFGEKDVWVFEAGKFPSQPVDASPFYPGSALVDNYCAKSGTDWNGVSKKNRIIASIYVHKVENTLIGGEISLSKREMKQVCEDARSGCQGAMYSKACLIYKDLEKKDELPKLTVNPNSVIPNNHKDTGFVQ